MNVPKFAEIEVSGELTPDDFDAMATACQRINFAIVRSAFPGLTDDVAEETRRYAESVDVGRGWRRASQASEGSFMRDSGAGDLVEFPNLLHVMHTMAIGLGNAAERQGTRRVAIGPAITGDVMIANTYQEKGYIARHFDENQGVVFVSNTEGIGEVRLSDADERELSRTELTPGDWLVLPAVVDGVGGPFNQAWHEVVNRTPSAQGNGVRRSIAGVYRNIDAPENDPPLLDDKSS